MKDFVAIDFETANANRSSICSVGIVIVRDGKIGEKLYRLIRPQPNFYSYWNTQIHGMSEYDTAKSPNFPEVWVEITPLIEGLPFVAHNSPFDESCLRKVHEFYEMPYSINYQFHCTLRAARQEFSFLPNHQLHTVAAHCGYNLHKHHHALADAEACAVIALNIM